MFLPYFPVILCLFHAFFVFLLEKQKKALRKSILTSERCAEHPFAGGNKQHLFQFRGKLTNKGVWTKTPVERDKMVVPFDIQCGLPLLKSDLKPVLSQIPFILRSTVLWNR